MDFIVKRELVTSFEYDIREAESLPELREVMSKNDFAQIKRYRIVTRLILLPPAEGYETPSEKDWLRKGEPQQNDKAGWLQRWWNSDAKQRRITVTIQEDDKAPVEVYNHEHFDMSDSIYTVHHEWVKNTYSGVMK